MSFNRVNPIGYAFGSSVSSASFNTLDVDHSNSASDAQTIGGVVANWQAAVPAAGLRNTVGGVVLVAGAAWDPGIGVWYLTLNQTTTPTLLYSTDGGKNFIDTTVGGFPAVAITNAMASHTNDVLIPLTSANSSTVCQVVYVAGTAGFTTNAALAANLATSLWSPNFSRYLMYSAYQAGGSFSSGGFTITNGTSFTGYTSVPSGWNSATNNVGQLLSAQSPTITLIALCGVTAGTDTSRLLQVTNDGSGNPIFADVTSSQMTNRIVTGLAYSPQLKTWGMALYDGTNSYFYNSTDLVTWTNIYTFTGYKTGGLASVGPVWVVAVNQTAQLLLNAIGGYRPFLSMDNGTTWRAASGPKMSNASKLVSSGNQVAMFDQSQIALSLQSGDP